jgi:hypothetical protein
VSRLLWKGLRVLGYRTFLASKVQARRDRKRIYRYVIAYTVGDTATKWLAWDHEQVWRWTKSIRQAAQFRSEQQAITEAESTSMVWQYNYTVRRL